MIETSRASMPPKLREQDNPECDNCGNALEREFDPTCCSSCAAPHPGWEESA